jgi:hypothetical protein
MISTYQYLRKALFHFLHHHHRHLLTTAEVTLVQPFSYQVVHPVNRKQLEKLQTQKVLYILLQRFKEIRVKSDELFN